MVVTKSETEVNLLWVKEALKTIHFIALSRRYFSPNTIWFYLEQKEMPEISHKTILNIATKKAERLGWIKKTKEAYFFKQSRPAWKSKLI